MNESEMDVSDFLNDSNFLNSNSINEIKAKSTIKDLRKTIYYLKFPEPDDDCIQVSKELSKICQEQKRRKAIKRKKNNTLHKKKQKSESLLSTFIKFLLYSKPELKP